MSALSRNLRTRMLEFAGLEEPSNTETHPFIKHHINCNNLGDPPTGPTSMMRKSTESALRARVKLQFSMALPLLCAGSFLTGWAVGKLLQEDAISTATTMPSVRWLIALAIVFVWWAYVAIIVGVVRASLTRDYRPPARKPTT